MVLLLLSALACNSGNGKETGDTADTGGDTADTDTADTSDTDTADTSDTDTADTSDTDTADTADTDTPEARGAALYAADCVVCHGADGTAGIDGASNLVEDVPNLDDAAITDVVLNGKDEMPAFAYTEAQMADLLAFLRETFPAPVE
jgi:mono/diheme cytochrome c family protein